MRNKNNNVTYWNTYKAHVRGVILQAVENDSKDISYWRNEIFLNILIYITPLSIIALIPGVYIAFSDGPAFIGIVDLLAFMLLVLLLTRRNMTLQFRKSVFIFIFYLLAITLIYYLSNMGPGLLFLLAITIITSIVSSSSAGYYSAFVNTLICGGFGMLYYLGIRTSVATDYSLGSWIAVTSNLVLLSFACAKCMDLLFVGLASSLLENKE